LLNRYGKNKGLRQCYENYLLRQLEYDEMIGNSNYLIIPHIDEIDIDHNIQN